MSKPTVRHQNMLLFGILVPTTLTLQTNPLLHASAEAGHYQDRRSSLTNRLLWLYEPQLSVLKIPLLSYACWVQGTILL